MKTIRRIVRDRRLSSKITLALIYLIMLQSVVASMALGTLASANAGPLQIICTANGMTAVKHLPGGDIPNQEAPRWHCATLCQVSSAAAPAVLGPQAGLISAPQAKAPVAFLALAEILRPSFQRWFAEARAPPFSI